MTQKDELKHLISKMNEQRYKWFISQMRLLLFEEASVLARLSGRR